MGAFDQLKVHVGLGIKVLDLTGDAHREIGGVKGGDGPCSGDASRQVGPELFHCEADRGYSPQAGDDCTLHKVLLIKGFHVRYESRSALPL